MAERHDDTVRTRKTSGGGVPGKKTQVQEHRWSLRMRMAPEKEYRALVRIAAALQALCLLAVFGVTDVLAQSSNAGRRGPVSLSLLIQGDGTVTSSPSGLSCNDGICGGVFPRGTVVRLMAQPGEGQILSRWGGACRGTREQCRIRLRRSREVVATFQPPPSIPLRVFLRGEGTVTSPQGSLECSNRVCRGSFPQGSLVTLQAVPGENQSFRQWRGACRGNEDCVVTMRRRSRNVLASFTSNPPPQSLPLTVSIKGSGSVLSDPNVLQCAENGCKGEFPVGTVVTLTPKPGADQMFTEWGGACQGQAPEACSVKMTTSMAVTAAFEALPPTSMTLTLNVVGQGTVVSEPKGIECTVGTCTGEFVSGTMVSLLPTPGEGHTFGEWNGACTGSGGCIIDLTAPANQTASGTLASSLLEVTATFVLLPPPNVDLSVQITGEGSVTSDPAGISCPTESCTVPFPGGTRVTLMAAPADGHIFSGWSGACTGTDACILTLVADTGASALPATAVSAAFVPSSSGGLSDAEAIRFLEQSTWGPTPTSMAHLKEVGITTFLGEQFNAEPSIYPDPVSDSDSLGPLYDQWFFNAFHGEDQLRQRVAFALSQLFVVSGNTVGTDEQMIPYQRMLHENAFGNFRDLMRMVTLSPAMGRFLDMVNNDKTDPSSGLNPNENYARELLQLFTVGTTLLNPDGSNQLDTTGQPIPTYDQDVIINLSRVFTGWTYPTKPGSTLQWRNPAYYDGPLEAVESHHDTEAKVLMNGVVVSGGGTALDDLEAALNHIFLHPNVGPFVATRLIRNLVTSNPSPEYIQRVSTVFNADDNGVRGNMQAVISSILTDPEAAIVTPNGGHLREPILYAIALLRALSADVQLDNVLFERARDMGQSLFSPPSVFNYFSPLYMIPGTTLFGPEYQIHTLSSSIARVNFVNRVVTNTVGTGVTVNLANLEAVAADADQLIDAVIRTLLHEPLSDAERAGIKTALEATNNLTTRARNAVYLVATSGRYQVQH